MQTFRFFVIAACVAALVTACQRGDKNKDKDKGTTATDAAAAGMQPPANPANPHAANQEKPPMDLTTPPTTAKKSASGMSYVVLAEGSGDKKPGRNDTAQANYTVWKTSGETLFSTKRRGQPQPMPLSMIPQGWSETLLDMKPGERRLVWMPSTLAMRGGAGAQPPETYVFEMELVSFEAAPPVPPDLAAPPADAVKTKSGLAYKILAPGTGKEKARSWDQIKVNYTAWSTDGLMFESTAIRQQPRTLSAFQESSGWAEAVKSMVVGQKTRVWMPANLVPKRPGVPEGMQVYDIELVELQKMTDPPPVPKTVAAPPKDAKKTEKGVFYKVLKKGTGKDHPTADNRVKVHYTGWTTDGNMFDSSVVRGQPAEFPLRNVIPGWTDGIPVMVMGDRTIFWIPEELAYKGQQGRPQGMLVFEVELLEILPGAPPPAPPAIPGHGQLGGAAKPGAAPATPAAPAAPTTPAQKPAGAGSQAK